MQKRHLSSCVALASLALLAGCVTAPTGPSAYALPGSRTSLEQFHADDLDCRGYATAVLGGPGAAQQANEAAAGHAVAGTMIGAAAGALLGAASGQASQGAAFGAGTGLLFGSAVGSNASVSSSYSLQRGFDAAYFQCMYSRGHQVPGHMASRSPAPVYSPSGNHPGASYPPPNYPPPGYPPPNAAPPR